MRPSKIQVLCPDLLLTGPYVSLKITQIVIITPISQRRKPRLRELQSQIHSFSKLTQSARSVSAPCSAPGQEAKHRVPTGMGAHSGGKEGTVHSYHVTDVIWW